MNQKRLQSQWNKLEDLVRQQWGKLRERFQVRYGRARGAVRKEVDAWLAKPEGNETRPLAKARHV